MLLFVAFRRQMHQPDIHIRLHDALNADVEITANLIGGFHVAIDAHLANRQLLPAQTTRGDVRQQLRRIHRTANLHQPFRRAA